MPIKIIQEMDGVIVSSNKLARDLEQSLGIPGERIETAYLASNSLPTTISRQDACRELGLSPEKRYVVYTGKLLMPEVSLILDAAECLKTISPDAEVLFVGGNPQILDECHREVARRRIQNVRFAGFIPPARVALYQSAADVLMLYLTKDRDIIDYITPSKVFDYLQAGRPIVVSDYPILHEILEHGHNALFVPPHAPEEFAKTIALALNNKELSAHLSRNAEISGERYSWEKRVQLIWRFIERVYMQKYSVPYGQRAWSQ
jgi:glycosyltransferase involved in cell wall biosynthesis